MPFALPPDIAVAESCARDWVVVATGTPLITNAAEEEVLLPERTKTPEPVAFWKKKFVVDAVVTFKVVPVAFTKNNPVVEAMVTFSAVPVAAVNEKKLSVEETDHSCVDDAPAVKN